jgi:hypothetical protein
MGNIEKYINDLGEIFQGIERLNDGLIVKVVYPEKWKAYNSDDGRIKYALSETEPNTYYYYGNSSDVTFDDLFKLIIETKVMNEEVVRKVNYLKEKIQELDELFKEKTMDELVNLEFVIKKTKRKKKVKEVEVLQNKEEVEPNTENVDGNSDDINNINSNIEE